jgi:beta-lactamase regulating signal transducer with metallopeptidase domain
VLWWTIQNLVTAGLMAGVVWLLCRCCRIGAVGRHALWLVVLVKLLTPPLVAWPWAVRDPLSRLTMTPAESPFKATAMPANAPPLLPSVVVRTESSPATDDALPVVAKSPAMASVGAASASPQPASKRPASKPSVKPAAAAVPVGVWLAKSLRWAGWLWLAGGILFGLVHLTRIVRMIRLRRHSQPADAALLERIGIISERLGLRPVETRVAPGIRSPLVWCLLRREMLWPAVLPEMAELSIRGLIVHELAHLKRRDHWVGWLELAAGCFWWWNPLYWYVRHQLRENAELACDAWVVQTLPDGRRAYAEGLLAVCESTSEMRQGTSGGSRHISRPPTPMPVLGVGGGSRQVIERRLAMILRERIPLHIPRAGWLMIALLTAGTLPAWSQQVPVAPQPEQRIQPVPVLPPAIGSGGIGFTAPSALPADAQALIAESARQEAEIRAELEKKLTAHREQLIAQLRELQDRYTKAGQLDEAVAIRDQIRQMSRRRVAIRGVVRPMPDPGDATQFRGQHPRQILLMVTGRTDGQVWGNGVYSDDSTIAAAAVHAGLLQPGQTGLIMLTVLPGQDHYDGSVSNGVTSMSYGPWPGSYSIAGAVSTGRGYAPQPGGVPLRDDEGGVIGAPNRTGIDVPYSFDASGGGQFQRLPAGDDVNLQYFPYDGTARSDRPLTTTDQPATNNPFDQGKPDGTQNNLGSGQGAYQLWVHRAPRTSPQNNAATGQVPGGVPVTRVPLGWQQNALGSGEPTLDALRDDAAAAIAKTGHPLVLERLVTGTTTGTVWGSDVYTDDSSIEAAAVHAGVLRDGEQGWVRITLLPDVGRYTGSERNGVTSQDWNDWGGCFRIDRAAPRAGGPGVGIAPGAGGPYTPEALPPATGGSGAPGLAPSVPGTVSIRPEPTPPATDEPGGPGAQPPNSVPSPGAGAPAAGEPRGAGPAPSVPGGLPGGAVPPAAEEDHRP